MERNTLLVLLLLMVLSSCSVQKQGRNYTLNESRVKTETQKKVAVHSEHTDSWLMHEDDFSHGKEKHENIKEMAGKTSPAHKDENTAPRSVNARLNAREKVVSIAQGHLGAPYKYGGNGPKTFDCSGFTKYCMRDIGVELARNSTYQAKQGRKIQISEARKGDLIFFGKGNRIQHVGIIIARDDKSLTMIHVSSSQGVVVEDVMSSKYWKSRLLYAVDIVNTAESEFIMSGK